MANLTEKQMDYMLKLANQLTGQRARYASQSSVLPKAVKTSAEASALIDELVAAIEVHEKWQQETGLIIGARIRRQYTLKDGRTGVVSGVITRYEWSGLSAAGVYVDLDEHAEAVTPGKWYTVARLGEEAAADPVAALEDERARLVARLAEIDAQLAALRA